MNTAPLLHHLYAGHSLKRQALFAPTIRPIVNDREQSKEVPNDHEQQDQGHDIEPLVLMKEETELTLLNNDQAEADRAGKQEGEVGDDAECHSDQSLSWNVLKRLTHAVLWPDPIGRNAILGSRYDEQLTRDDLTRAIIHGGLTNDLKLVPDVTLEQEHGENDWRGALTMSATTKAVLTKHEVVLICACLIVPGKLEHVEHLAS